MIVALWRQFRFPSWFNSSLTCSPLILKATIPVPCEDHYSRPIVALSTAVSPLWVLWYLEKSLTIPVVMYILATELIAYGVLRFADDEKMPLIFAVSTNSILISLLALTYQLLPNLTYNFSGSFESVRILYRSYMDRQNRKCSRRHTSVLRHYQPYPFANTWYDSARVGQQSWWSIS